MAAPLVLAASELGNSADAQKAAVVEREQLPVRAVPATLRLTYYDPSRDYQTGEARAIAGEESGNEAQRELPAVLSADDAKTIVQHILARQWAARDRLTLRLRPARMGLEPGAIVQPSVAPGSWLVDRCTIEGFVTIAELRPLWHSTAALAADGGRIIAGNDVVQGPTSLLLIDAADPMQPEASAPAILIAASSAEPGWSARALSVSCSGHTFATETAVRKSVLGSATSVLADAEPYLIDAVNSVEVELVDAQQWLTSCDDDALADGMNLALLGGELVQFAEVAPLGQGCFRLSRLLRGRGGTEWAAATHAAGEPFCLIDRSSLRALPVPQWARGAILSAADRDGSVASVTFNGESVRPLQPANLSAVIDGAGNLALEWMRRSRSGFAWVDEIDAPIGESREQYRVTISGVATSLDYTSEQPSFVVPAFDLASIGSGSASVEVRQLGDWSASRAAHIMIDLP